MSSKDGDDDGVMTVVYWIIKNFLKQSFPVSRRKDVKQFHYRCMQELYNEQIIWKFVHKNLSK